MGRDVQHYVENCRACQLAKLSYKRKSHLLQRMPTPTGPFTDVLHTHSQSRHSLTACSAVPSTLLQSVREEHFYTRFALMSFDLPRAKVGEAGWALKLFLPCSHEGGVLRLPSKRDTARKLPVVFKSSWRVKMARQARGRGAVALDGQASSLYFKARMAPLRATIGGSAPSGAPSQTSGCWRSRGPRVPIGRSSTELIPKDSPVARSLSVPVLPVNSSTNREISPGGCPMNGSAVGVLCLTASGTKKSMASKESGLPGVTDMLFVTMEHQ
eukprot:scaffold2861_cov386-Pavlova_lutheri.AAC.5